MITAMPRIAQQRIPLLPENNVRKGFADAKQVDTICKCLKPDVADAVRLAFPAGWRRAEVFTLTWSQVDWNGGFVRLEPGRRRTRRVAPSPSRRPPGQSSSGAKR